jgi:PII-like signaling protein
VNEDCLKLTTYFGERQRTDGRFVADALLDLYGRSEVQVSVMLRGVEGFGLRNHLRTDRLLTLSEDLPVVSVAVDTRDRIERLLGDVLSIKRHGLITLERARLLTGRISTGTLPEELDQATKLTIYVGRQERVGGLPAFVAVCDLLHRRGLAGATVLLGVDGTAHGLRQRARFFGHNAQVPMMIIAVGPGGLIAGVLPELSQLLPRPLLTLERIQICKREGRLLTPPPSLAAAEERGLALWQKLMIHTSEQAQYHGRALHVALVRHLRAAGASGATSLRGIWGFDGERPPHGDRLLQVRRRVPVVTIVVDTPERIAQQFTIVDRLTSEGGLVTSEIVPAMTALADGQRRRGGLRLAPRNL